MQHHSRSVALSVGLVAGFAALATSADAAFPKPADTVLRNGRVYTATVHHAQAQAVAIRDGRIVFTGSNGGARAFVGPKTKVTNLRGRMVMPGLEDGHMHPLGGGANLLKCSLDYLPLTVPQIQQRIAACLKDSPAPAGTWLQVINWYQEAMLPAGATLTAQDLDAVGGNRPIVVQSSFYHSIAVNTLGLKVAGVTAATPDPADGSIGRDPSGAPNGLFNDGAQGLVSSKVPAPTAADDVAAAKAALAAMRANGVTSFLDAAASPTSLKAFRSVQRNGGLTARAHFAPVVDVDAGKDPVKVVATLKKLRRTYDQGPIGVRPSMTLRNAKVFMDGVQQFPAQTAGLLAPYLVNKGTDDHPDWVPGTRRGPVYFNQSELKPLLAAIGEAGFDPHIHAIGDRAVRNTLDAIEYMRKRTGKADVRPAIAHAEIVDPADYPRFKQLGAIPVMSFQWAKPGPDSIEAQKDYIGPARFSRVEPEGFLERAGARVTYGSDWPVDSLNEWFAIQVGITRQNPAGGHYAGRFNDVPKLTRTTTLRAITARSAYELHQDGQTGTLEPGKDADLIVLDRNVLRIPATKIQHTKVLLTMVGGKTVYRAAGSR